MRLYVIARKKLFLKSLYQKRASLSYRKGVFIMARNIFKSCLTNADKSIIILMSAKVR
nr:MAG TPA: hypothetical protein [Caudoviricetes sp.]